MKTTLLALLLGASAAIAAQAADLALRYDQPATSWMREALPIGNGYMGAMLFGGVDADQIQFNEESLWIGDEGDTGAYQGTLDTPSDKHRHMSHLVGLYPGRQFSLQQTPALAEAARVSLDARGDDGIGWSTAKKINLWARLQDGDRAHKLIGQLFNLVTSTDINYTDGGGLYANLLNAGPPFQIEGNFGYTAGICEMLLQSQEENSESGMNGTAFIPHPSSFIISLLPALPKAWAASGSVTGLRARGGFSVDIEWKDGKVVNYRIASPEPGKVKVRVNGETKTIQTEKQSLHTQSENLK